MNQGDAAGLDQVVEIEARRQAAGNGAGNTFYQAQMLLHQLIAAGTDTGAVVADVDRDGSAGFQWFSPEYDLL